MTFAQQVLAWEQEFTRTVATTILMIVVLLLLFGLLAACLAWGRHQRRRRSPAAFYEDFNATFGQPGQKPLVIQRRKSLPAGETRRVGKKEKRG